MTGVLYKRQERKYNLKKRYGISLEEYENLLEAQQFKCKICGTTEAGNRHGTMVVDHHHESGQVRGLLCHNCNVMLGHAKDNVLTLSGAIDYLRAS